MPISQLGPVDVGYVDRRRALKAGADHNLRTTRGTALFTANASGTTTTIVGANAAPGTADTNVIRRGEKFRLFTAAGALKEDTVFEVAPAGIAVAASTTVTFAPAAAVATASGDVARAVDDSSYQDDENLDSRLTALGRSAQDIRLMTQNDKVYAIRVADDSGGI